MDNKKHAKIWYAINTAFWATIVLLVVTYLATITIAAYMAYPKKYGLNPMNAPKIWQESMRYNGNDELTEDNPKPGTVIIWFRYGCKDCEAAKGSIDAYLEETGQKAYWCYTRSDNGKKLRETYKVTSVPSAMLITGNGECIIKDLYDAETGTFLEENLNRIFELKEAYAAQLKQYDKNCAP